MTDKRDECGCHQGCHYDPHECDNPCRWPDCMTADERTAFLDELKEDDG